MIVRNSRNTWIQRLEIWSWAGILSERSVFNWWSNLVFESNTSYDDKNRQSRTFGIISARKGTDVTSGLARSRFQSKVTTHETGLGQWKVLLDASQKSSGRDYIQSSGSFWAYWPYVCHIRQTPMCSHDLSESLPQCIYLRSIFFCMVDA